MDAFDVADEETPRGQHRRVDDLERERVDLSSFEEVMWDYIARQAREDSR